MLSPSPSNPRAKRASSPIRWCTEPSKGPRLNPIRSASPRFKTFGSNVALLASLLLSACGGSQLGDAALHGDLPTLQQEIAKAKRAGTLDEGETRKLALAVARRELLSSKGD